MISEESLLMVKATAPVVKDNAIAITSTFYPKLLGRYPELYNYFNESNQKSGSEANALGNFPSGGGCPGFKSSSAGQQTKTLADAIIAYAMNIDKLENLSEVVGRMCHKHAALGVKPEHYQIVHDVLMESIGEVLGDAATAAVAAAWSEAVMALAKICISTEEELYKKAAELQWTGTREFTVSAIVQEGNDIVSIRLTPVDGKGTCCFEPGQYITVYERPKDKIYFAPRHYTVTSQPGDCYYQVTVKKMASIEHEGIMSHYLHNKKVGDSVMLGPVFGPAPLKNSSSQDRAAVFVSAGVGITPTVAMLAQATRNCKRVAVFHDDRTPESMAFRSFLEDTIGSSEDGVLDISFAEDIGLDLPFVSQGRMTGRKILDRLQTAEIDYKEGADFFVCAGASNTPAIYKELVMAGVNQDRIHLEYFTPFVTVELEE
jgi:nitric oxide dioxygenase